MWRRGVARGSSWPRRPSGPLDPAEDFLKDTVIRAEQPSEWPRTTSAVGVPDVATLAALSERRPGPARGVQWTRS